MNETLLRALTGSLYVTLVLASTLHPISFVVLFGLFLALAVWEFCKMNRMPITVPILGGIVFYLLFHFFSFSEYTLTLLLICSLLASVRATFFMFSTSPLMLSKNTKLVFLIGYIVMPFVLLSKIPFLTQAYSSTPVILLFVLIWANDTFAYLVGKTWGKTKLLERISPKKTREGFIGGLICTTLLAVLIGYFFQTQSIGYSSVFALLVGIGSTIGDLIESKFKRVAGVKDSGKLLPGHGGILDRLDSIIFVAPLAYLFFKLIPYVS
jgi:phosphatidate cytidylyltransferase